MNKRSLKRKSLNKLTRKTLRHSNIKGLSKYNDTEEIDWKGYYRYYGYYFVDYLNHEYDNVCANRGLCLQFISKLCVNQSGKNFDAFKYSKDLNEVHELFHRCKKRFVVIPVTFLRHQNILIFDTISNEFELFDSYGNIVKDEFIKGYEEGYGVTHSEAKEIFDVTYNKYIEQLTLFCNIMSKGSKFFEPMSFFPKGKDFQDLEIKSCPNENFKINSWGFCVVWSFWYAENRLKYPNKSREKIISELMELFETGKADNVICKVIRGYTIFLTKLDKDKTFYQRHGLHYYLYRDLPSIQVKIMEYATIAFSLMFLGARKLLR
jgi:hypothetical protein